MDFEIAWADKGEDSFVVKNELLSVQEAPPTCHPSRIGRSHHPVETPPSQPHHLYFHRVLKLLIPRLGIPTSPRSMGRSTPQNIAYDDLQNRMDQTILWTRRADGHD